MIKLKGWFQNSRKELRFVDYVSEAFFFYVVIYTIGDLKNGYPVWLVLFGIIMHFFAVLIILEKNWIVVKGDVPTRPKYFNESTSSYSN